LHIFTSAFFFGFLNIVFININLSGDNAVAIATAARFLLKRERQWRTIRVTARVFSSFGSL
jgi:predicted tellurium resistance membrane protein TerC